MKNTWTTLDHAAKIFPAGTYGTETQVFRFSCELYEQVDPDMLQSALDQTLDFFPSYRVVLRHGFFWYYLQESDLRAVVKPETKRVCQSMGGTKNRRLLFEVTYFEQRINLEVYHVLSDGTSAMQFLKHLVTEYLAMRHHLSPGEKETDASYFQSKDDSYARYYSGQKIKREKVVPACRIQGARFSGNFLRNITGRVSLQPVMELARKYHVTITVLLAACMILSIGEHTSVKERKKPIVLSVPVNLRNAFPSVSARNFFGTVLISYDWRKGKNTLEMVIQEIEGQMKEKLTEEHLAQQMDAQSGAEHNIFARLAPLFLKNIVLKQIYKNNMKGVTATISNVGKVHMESQFEPYVQAFDVCASTNKWQACICSFHDSISISCTNPHISSDLERILFRMLADQKADIQISGNFMEE